MVKKRNSRMAEPDGGFSLVRLAVGTFFGLLLTVLLTFSASVAMNRELLPMESCRWLGPVLIGVSAFFSAWIAAKHPCKKLLHGLLAAFLYGLALLIGGMLLFSSPMQVGRMLISMGALAVGAVTGVFVASFRV